MLPGLSRLLGPALAALAVTALAGCDLGSLFGQEREITSTLGGRGLQRDPATLIVGRPTDAIWLDPGRPSDSESIEVIEQIYDKLIHHRPGSNTIEPGLATSWEVTENGTVWTFALRRGVRFHDGTPFDADAVVFSFERQRDPFHPYHRKDKFQYWQNMFRNVEKVEKVGPYEVRIIIERSYAPFAANLAMFSVAIVSPTAVKKWGDDFDQHPVGTGPFVFESWERGERIVVSRNGDYWGGAPAFERVVFQVIRDPRQRLIALESGAIDIAYSILPEELQFVELHPGMRLHRIPANNVAYMAMNNSHPPFDDRRVRQAANYAINKEPIVKLVYQEGADPAVGPLPPGQWGYHRPATIYGYNPARARELLEEARLDGRFDPQRTHTLYVSSTPRPYLLEPERIGRVLQTNLASVGIKTRILVQEFRPHLRAVQRGEHDLCLLGWVGDNGDPDNFLYTLFDQDNTSPPTARNVAFFKDAHVHGLLVQAQESESRAERESLYAKVQELIAVEAPWVPLAHFKITVAARADVGGVIVNPQSHVYYRLARRIER